MWNPMTADEPDPWPGMRSDAIEARAEKLMSDEGWIEATLEDGALGEPRLVAALAAAYQPGESMTRVGGLLMDVLWDKAYAEATQWIDNGDYCDG